MTSFSKPDQTPATRTEGADPKRTLLVVDDDDGPRKSIQMLFRRDYRVLTADDGNAALELIREYPIDAAIVDIRMGGMSGIELLAQIKANDPSIEVIMLTGYETVETVREALRLGACDYLSKPFAVETLRGAVASAMERRSLSEELRSTQQKMDALRVELQQQAIREEITRNKGEIYASVLHDINSPLTIIAGYIQLINLDLERNEAGASSLQLEGVKDHLRQINRQVTHCIDISQRYLGFLRRKPSEQTFADVNRALTDLGQLLRAHPSRRKNQLEIQPLPETVAVAINGADLIQILLNLAINGLQCTTEVHRVCISGKVVEQAGELEEVTGQPHHCVLKSASFSSAPHWVRLSVSDDGPGIPAANLSCIFQPFFSTKAEKGTGLGLAIVQRLILEAHGAVHVHSEPGHGAAFHVYLPLWKKQGGEI